MTWLILQSKQSGTLIVQGEVGGSAACFAASTSCHLGQDSCCELQLLQ